MANGELTLELFGTFRAAGHAPITGFRTDKARALLAYLAVEADRAHARANLATLLWPNMLDDVALRNLRKTLHRLNEMLAESLSPTSEAVFLTTRQSIQLNPDSCELDVATFGELLETSATHPHRHLHLCEPCLDRLTRAASLYRGELLAGFGIPDAEPFEEWLLLKRERFHHLALRVLHDLAAAHLEREEYDRAYTYATRQVELDPGREEAHRQVIRALARKGQRSEALTYARQARQMLLDTLGVEPAPETVALTEQLRQAETGAASAQVTNRSLYAEKTRLHNLPTQLTPFVGRQTELLWIAGQLRDPECRIVSILGPGGIGKTRLAVRAAENLAGRGRFPDGVTFIALAEVRTAQQLPAALATGLELELDERSDARAQLLHYLAAKDCLLVLDNFEQLLGEVDFLVDILTRTPGVCILVTSRLPLGLQAEQRVQLRGLDYPGQIDETSPARHPPETAGTGIASASSVQLFIQAARRVDPSFSLSVANERDVLRICRLVDGMPLALQLAAPWVRVMDCAAIAAAIERSLELLATNARDVPDRQRSIEGVFAESWRLLAPGERAALAQLSVFHGPFDLEAAVSIAGASALELASLLDKGLLHRGGDGRYQLHELLRQFGTAAAASVPDVNLDSVRDRHSSYYLGLVATGESALYGPNARIATSALEDQRGNLRQAWLWAAEHGRQQALESSLEGIVRFWELTSRFEAAETMLAEAASFVQRSHDANVPPDSKVSALLTRLLVWEAHFGETRDRIDDAIEVAEAALRVAQSAIDLEGEALARMVLGEILPHRGEFVRAIAQLEAACAYFADHGHPRRLARALGRLGTAHWRACEYSSAAEQLERARVLQESLGDQWELARVSSSLAGVAFEQGDLERAQVRAEAALALYQASGDRRSIAAIRGNLALIYQLLGRFELALQHNQCDVETSRQLGDRHSAATALGNRASIFLEGGARKEALDCFQEALQIEEELGNTWDAARHRAGVARLLHLQGEREMALAHFEQALPILRARDAPYYTVDPLLNAAELQLDRARVEEAAELTREATAAARKLDLREQLMQGQVLEAKIARARGEPDLGWTLLQQLLSKAEDEIERALLHYELWHTWHDEAHADAALRLYRDLYERSPRHVYRVRVAELAASLSTSQEVSPL